MAKTKTTEPAKQPVPESLTDFIAELLFEVIVAEVAKVQTVSGNQTKPKQ